MNNMRIVEIPASMRENAGRKNTARKLRRPTAVSAPRKKNSRAVLKSRNCTTPRKSIPPRSGKSRASTRMTVSPAYIPRSVTVLTR